MPTRLTALDLSELWLKLTAAEARSSGTWLTGLRFKTLQVYSPSLGLLRKIVEVAEPYHKDFADYITALNPHTVRRLLNIVQVAKKLQLFHLEKPATSVEAIDARTDRFMELLTELTEALSGVKVP